MSGASQPPAPAAAPAAGSYAAAGVDIEAGDRAVELMKEWVKKTRRPESVGALGGFAGLFDASALKRYERPLLASATDGVGTKVAIAQRMDVHDTIGHDLVAMVVDDLVVTGAEPLFMTDYICVGKVVPERVAAIVKGIAEGCVLAGCALVGGETAEHPGLLGPDEYDVAGAGTGVVEADAVLGADRIRTGDAVVAMASSGLHSNGYSLVRHVLLDRAGWALDRAVPEFGRTLGEELLAPTKIYSLDCLALLRATEVHAFSHVTGGGLASNLARVVPEGLRVVIDRGTWAPGAVFDVVGEVGRVERAELERTLNMGVGMVAVVPQASVDVTLTLLADRGVDAWVAGEVRGQEETGAGGVELTGGYAR
ncbi:phosphoribosylformylglycinamidine cyclo-ligase [Streptomyces sp. CMB-StM0423]|uniref:phosphoribosylformylglycinamidine cyclo-ligase n=1 Tax=Streptomyces sp. CMB-StM0423 TaxID=2059884 RepID=UPI000C70CC7E|nr:phosphoribosylformylglycinamidine cyclo-ligase [Streptomyces sp. CMB-StM0423]AUH44925.1 phosphoribosylformylglycinamidine cyclo-ligase [Streptomyces sp. CMB-StM0423]